MTRTRGRGLLIAGCLVVAGLAVPATAGGPGGTTDLPVALDYGFQGEGDARIRDVDNRVGSLQPTAAQLAAARSLGAEVRWNAFGTPHVITRYDGRHLSAPSTGKAADVARQWVRNNAALFRLTPAAIDAMQVVTNSPFYDSPDLRRMQAGLPAVNTKVAHAVVFRQVFDGLHAGQDGLLGVGVMPDGAVTFAWSSVTSDTEVRGAQKLDALDAYLKAAADVGRKVARDDLSIVSERSAKGFTTFRAKGVDELQYARQVALPTPTQGIRRAWEIVVLDNSPKADHPTAFIHFIDADTGKVLWRQNRVDHLADVNVAGVSALAEPSSGPFSGETKKAACGADHPFDVPEGNKSIVIGAVVEGDPDSNDITIRLDYVQGKKRTNVGSADLLGHPEVLTYTPEGGVKPGRYVVNICPFTAAHPPMAYQGYFQPTPIGASFPSPRWRVFPSNPQIVAPGGKPAPDDREVWCWTDGAGCDRIVGQAQGVRFPAAGNSASRAPWDFDVRRNLPWFSTRGNNAETAPSYISPLTPDTYGTGPVSPERDYDFPFTNQWFTSNCNPASFTSPERNDLDAASVSLFTGHNRMHDWAYYLGFTEQNFNMQRSNFGNTAPGPFPVGREEDPEIGQTQSGSIVGGPTFLGRDNANQITLMDGIPGITNQYLWQPLQAGFYAACSDGAYDMSVVAHEYGHAVSNRMTAGPDSGLSGAQSGAMGESWSDLTAIEILNEYGLAGSAGEDKFSVGAFVTGARKTGIRNYNMGKSPLNYSNLGYDGNGATSPHADGEVWSAVNYDLRDAFVKAYNKRFPAGDKKLQVRCADGELAASACPGNRRWIQLMHDGFLLQPGSTSMVDSRDAQLAADRMRFGGADQRFMWDVYAKRGLGKGAFSKNADDTDPRPGWTSPLRRDSAKVRFVAGNAGGGVAKDMKVYVGVYEARVTPTAVAKGTAATGAVEFTPGTWTFIAQAPGYGAYRFTTTLKPGQSGTVVVPLRKNLASKTHGARATGDGGNLNEINDDTETTNWASLGEGPVKGKSVTVELADGRKVVREIQVSAALRPARPDSVDGEDPYDPGSQNRFSALRQFEVLVCDETKTRSCDKAENFKRIYVSKADAFPSQRPRPTAPSLTLKVFDVPDTAATHVRIRVVTNQCTGNPLYSGKGNPDDDPINDPDCVTGRASAGATGGTISLSQAENVRIAELQVFDRVSPRRQPVPPISLG